MKKYYVFMLLVILTHFFTIGCAASGKSKGYYRQALAPSEFVPPPPSVQRTKAYPSYIREVTCSSGPYYETTSSSYCASYKKESWGRNWYSSSYFHVQSYSRSTSRVWGH